MIVYGDSGRHERLDALASDLELEAERLARHGASLSDAREILIRAGELEQAVYDAPDLGHAAAEARLAARAATHEAASLFERTATGRPGEDAALRLKAAIRSFPSIARITHVKTPEGFAFYALYPDAYRFAAERWARDRSRRSSRDALVLGIRSIGTTLSAVVAERLRAEGWSARRFTVRPTGHPYRREASGTVLGAAHGLVVDEGPGLSGSSMVAGADLLHRSGVPDVALLPAHDHGPGAAASVSMRDRWKRADVYAAQDDAWLGSVVAAAAGAECAEIVDLGAGRWRQMVYGDERAWPDSIPALERPKFLVHSTDGRRVLLKFGGLAPAPHAAGARRTLAAWLADNASSRRFGSEEPVRTTARCGFLVREWIEGRPLRPEDAHPTFLESMGAYVARAAGQPLPALERSHAEERLARMVSVNVGEALGADAALAAVDRARLAYAETADGPTYGDGCMGPHEWIRGLDGRVTKVDVEGHTVDHTWVGAQPAVWDLAGAVAEWRLDRAGVERLLDGYEREGGRPIPAHVLEDFGIVYAAHRMGQAGLFAETERDPGERARMERSFVRWRAEVAMRISTTLRRCA